MKQLFFIRHAKSSWSNPGLSDFERPLNNRGANDAPKMAHWLSSHFKIASPALISSPAVRALSTAKCFAAELNIPYDQIQQNEMLYYGTAQDYILCLVNLKEDFQTTLVIGHNPMLDNIYTDLNAQTESHMPTCSILACTVTSGIWSDLKTKDIIITSFMAPKSL